MSPEDPVTPMAEMGSSLHELFIVLVAGGFSEWQACRVVGVLLAEQGRHR